MKKSNTQHSATVRCHCVVLVHGDGVMMMMSQNLSGKPRSHCVIVWCEQKRHCRGVRHGKESAHAQTTTKNTNTQIKSPLIITTIIIINAKQITANGPKTHIGVTVMLCSGRFEISNVMFNKKEKKRKQNETTSNAMNDAKNAQKADRFLR